MKTHHLSNEEKKIGVHNLLTHAVFNGLGFGLLGQTVVYLLAIHFNATNTQLGYIASCHLISGIIFIFLPKLLSGFKSTKVFFYGWLFRGIVCLLYGFTLFLNGQKSVLLILSVYTLFCISRHFGILVHQPLQKRLAAKNATGQLLLKMNTNFQSSLLAGRIISFLILSIKQFSGLIGLLFLQFFGVIFNTISSIFILKIPARDVIESPKDTNLFKTMIKFLKNKKTNLVIIIHWLSRSTLILIGLTIPFTKKIINMPENFVFLFTIVMSIGMVLSGFILKPFADKLGSKPILLLISIVESIVFLVISFIQPGINWIFIFIIGFVISFIKVVVLQLVSRLLIHSMPEEEKINFSSVMQFSSAIVALLIGFIAGKLIDLGEYLNFNLLNSYSMVFFAGAFISILTAILCFFLKEKGSMSLKQIANIFFPISNLRTFLDIYHFNITEDPKKRQFILMSLNDSDTPFAEHEIKKILSNPLSSEKEEVLKSLFVRPRPSLLQDIIEEAKDKYSYNRTKAIFALGAYDEKKVRQLLINILDETDPYVQSTAAKSLARLGNKSQLEKIKSLSLKNNNYPVDKMNYLIALNLMDKKGEYLQNIFNNFIEIKSRKSQQAYFSLVSNILNMSPSLNKIYEKENLKMNYGIKEFLFETKQLKIFYDNHKFILESYMNNKYKKIWNLCFTFLNNNKILGKTYFLKKSILTFDLNKINENNTIAVIYFTYQLLLPVV